MSSQEFMSQQPVFETKTYPNGDLYEGLTLHGQMHDQGKLTFSSGGEYSGSWQHGKCHGQGIYHYADGDVYEGSFFDS